MIFCRQKKAFTFIIFSFILFVLLPQFSFAKLFELSVAGGIRSGEVQEFVYDNETTVSRLDWKTPLVPVLNISGRLDIFHAILDLSVDSAIPVKLGSMQDYDWTGSDLSKYTNFSDHDLIVNKLYDLEAKLGYDFNLLNFNVPVDLSIIPQIGFLYRNQKFEACDGYYQYASSGEYWSSSIEKKHLSGTIITYETASYMPFISLEAEYAVSSSWRVKQFGRFFPYVYTTAIDNHNLRQTEFDDFMKNGLGFSIGAEASWKKLSLSVCYEWFRCKEGSTYQRAIGTNSSYYKASTTPGITSSVLSVMFSYRI